jgi:hypothetical protein
MIRVFQPVSLASLSHQTFCLRYDRLSTCASDWSLVRSVAYGESEVKLKACKTIINQLVSSVFDVIDCNIFVVFFYMYLYLAHLLLLLTCAPDFLNKESRIVCGSLYSSRHLVYVCICISQLSCMPIYNSIEVFEPRNIFCSYKVCLEHCHLCSRLWK